MSAPAESLKLNGINVLVLDDEGVIRQLVTTLLEREGAVVADAADGWQGLQILFDRSTDVLVVDMRMPKMDGVTFLQEALKIWPWMGVVVITGYDPRSLMGKLAIMGVTNVLQKPFAPDELVTKVAAEYRRMRDASVQEQRIPLRRIQQQLQVLRLLTEPALQAESLLDALRSLSDALGKTMDFEVIGVCAHELEQTAAIFNIRGRVSRPFIDEMEDYLLDRYSTFAGETLTDGIRVELTGRELVEYGAQALGTTFCVPIMGGGNLQGFLLLAATDKVQYDAAEVSFIYTVANHLSTIFSALDRMRSLAIHDPLTGLCNRLHLEAEVSRIWSWSRRSDHPMTILIIDLDHFKVVNDTYGHQAGDRVLKEFAGLLEETGRASDICGRYGGEEFVVVLVEADHTAAMSYANRLLKRVRQHTFLEGEIDLHMTVSIGLSVATMEKLEAQTMHEVLDEADRAMYVAKHAGRNCVRSWSQVQQVEEGRPKVARPSSPDEFGEETIIGRPITQGTILIVDDDSSIRSLLRELLVLENYQIFEAGDGAEALKYVESNPGKYDLVISDIEMPEMDGLELIKRVKAFDETMMCIIVSAHASVENAIESLRTGAYDFIQKPFSHYSQVFATVRRAMEYRKAVLENRQYQRHLSEMVRQKSAKAREALREVAASYSFTLEALTGLLDARERGTGIHSKRVRDLTMRLAKEFALGDEGLQAIGYGALLHDIGKIGIPDTILLKPGAHTPQEREVMRTHAQIGYRILSGSSYLRGAADIVHAHHETYDGKGYPNGLGGEAIPIGARIFAVVDAYDAMRTDRVYRQGMSEEEAVAEIIKMRGSQFDPAVVDVFLDCRKELAMIYDAWEDVDHTAHPQEDRVTADLEAG